MKNVTYFEALLMPKSGDGRPGLDICDEVVAKLLVNDGFEEIHPWLWKKTFTTSLGPVICKVTNDDRCISSLGGDQALEFRWCARCWPASPPEGASSDELTSVVYCLILDELGRFFYPSFHREGIERYGQF